MTLDDLLLSCRADTALTRLGCRTVDDVAALTRRQILATRNCGYHSLAEIEGALRRLDRSLTPVPKGRRRKAACVAPAAVVQSGATPDPATDPASLPTEGGQECTLTPHRKAERMLAAGFSKGT